MISTGARCMTLPISAINPLSACGPPVDEPISRTRGGVVGIGRVGGVGGVGGGASSPKCGTIEGDFVSSGARPERDPRSQALRAPPELADLLDQITAEYRGGAHLAIAAGLRNVVGGTQRQRFQADLGVSPRQRRGHDHDEVALFLEQERKRGDAVEVGHVDVEHDDIGINAFKLIDGLSTGAKRCNHVEIGFGFDPTREEAAHDDRVIDEHDADSTACANGRRRRYD